MRIFWAVASLVVLSVDASRAARCTTELDSRLMPEYETYVRGLETARASHLDATELSWVPENARKDAAVQLQSGQQVRWNISDPIMNQRVAGWNGTIINWIGAIRIRGSRIEDLQEVLQDYGRCGSIYGPLLYNCRAEPLHATAGISFEVTSGFQNTYRAVSLLPLQYSFEVRSRTDFTDSLSNGNRMLLVHSRSEQIRESDSGVPGRNDFLPPFHDHGIMWALNTYWRVRQVGADLYAEFEFVSLARSAQEFRCRIGLLPVPKSAISRVVEVLPSESLEIMLASTKAECERRNSKGAGSR